ncbi:MAG: hypothetical protein ACTHPS_10935 [Streptosporangiaceae bacterium]
MRQPIPARDRAIPTVTSARGCMPTPVVTRGWRCGPMRRPIPGHARVIRGWGRPPILARIPGWARDPVLSATRELRRPQASRPIPGRDPVRGQGYTPLPALIRGPGRAPTPALIHGSGTAPARDRSPERTRDWAPRRG